MHLICQPIIIIVTNRGTSSTDMQFTKQYENKIRIYRLNSAKVGFHSVWTSQLT